MKLKYVIVLVVSLLSYTTINGQSSQKILFASEVNPVQLNFMNMNGLERVYLIGLDDALPRFNKKTLATTLDNLIPDKNQIGYAVLDWEGVFLAALRGTNTTGYSYNAILNRFISTIKYAKMLRPNLKWGFYGLPPRRYRGVPLNFIEHNDLLYKELDFFSPSIYLWYEDLDGVKAEGLGNKFTTHFMASNLKYALKLGAKLNKPVYPFVWMRYSETYYPKIIDITSFTQYIKSILTTDNFGRKVDGIIWWDCINFLYERRTTNVGSAVLLDEFKNVVDINTYQTTLFQRYLDSIKPLFNY